MLSNKNDLKQKYLKQRKFENCISEKRFHPYPNQKSVFRTYPIADTHAWHT